MFYKKHANALPEKQAAHLSIAVDKEHSLEEKVRVKTERNVVHEHSRETSKGGGTQCGLLLLFLLETLL